MSCSCLWGEPFQMFRLFFVVSICFWPAFCIGGVKTLSMSCFCLWGGVVNLWSLVLCCVVQSLGWWEVICWVLECNLLSVSLAIWLGKLFASVVPSVLVGSTCLVGGASVFTLSWGCFVVWGVTWVGCWHEQHEILARARVLADIWPTFGRNLPENRMAVAALGDR